MGWLHESLEYKKEDHVSEDDAKRKNDMPSNHEKNSPWKTKISEMVDRQTK